MIELEELGRLLHGVVADPPHQVTVAAVRRQARRRRIVGSVTSAAAMFVVGGIGVAIALGAPWTTAPAAIGNLHPPTFYVVSEGDRTQVRSTATGVVTGLARCPHEEIAPTFVTALANHRTFFETCLAAGGDGDGFHGTRIYRFTLTDQGKARGYSLVRGGRLPGQSVFDDFAVSAGGALIAVDERSGGRRGPEVIEVINARTGSHAIWSNRDMPGGVHFKGATLSFADNGKVLGVFGPASCNANAPGCVQPGAEMIELSSPARGGQISSGRVVIAQRDFSSRGLNQIQDAYLSPDGSKVLLVVLNRGLTAYTLAQLTLATGKSRVTFTLPISGGASYAFVRPDATGRYVLFDAGGQRPEFGWIDGGRLITLRHETDVGLLTAAW